MLHELIMLLALSTILTACGMDNGEDGKPGADGKAPVCRTLEHEGKKFLKCIAVSGEVTEVEIKDGKPGENGSSSILSQISCRGMVAGSSVNYDVLGLSNGSALAIFSASYTSTGDLAFNESTSLMHKKDTAAKAALETKLWKVELSGMEAKVTRKTPAETKSIPCAKVD